MNWHAATTEAVLAELGTDPKHGVSASAADERLARHGPNQLPAAPRDTLLKRFLLQFHNVLIYVLLAAAIGTALLGEWIDTGVEFARTVAINTLVLGQMFYLFNSRYILAPSWNWHGTFGSRPVLLAAAALLVLQALFTYTAPMQTLFQTVPLALGDWLRIFAFGLFVFLAVEIEKIFLRRKTGNPGITI